MPAISHAHLGSLHCISTAIILYYIILCCVISYHIIYMIWYIIPYIIYHITSHHITSHHIIYYIILYYIILYYIILYYSILYYIIGIRGQSIKKPIFFPVILLLYLQLNQSCHLQSTPLHSWYTTPNFFPFLERVLGRVLRDGVKVPYRIYFYLLCRLKSATF